MTDPTTGGTAIVVHAPARGYSWAPFEPGNLVGLRHGAMSRYALAEADELAADLCEHVPHLGPADAPAIRDFAIAQVRAWRLAAWVEVHGELDGKGKPIPALAALREWLARAERARSRLGLDPMSRAALAVDALHARREATALAREALAGPTAMRLAAEHTRNIDPEEEITK